MKAMKLDDDPYTAQLLAELQRHDATAGDALSGLGLVAPPTALGPDDLLVATLGEAVSATHERMERHERELRWHAAVGFVLGCLVAGGAVWALR